MRRGSQLVLTCFLALASVCAVAAGSDDPPARTPAAPMLVQHVTFVGGEHVPASDLEKFAKDLEGTARITELRQKVADFWHSYGFYHVGVEAEPRMSANKWGESIGEITFKITEGPRYRLDELGWSGTKAFTSAELSAIFPVKPGDVFDTSEVRRGMGLIREAYAQKGYSQVAAIPVMRVNDMDHTISLDFEVIEGVRSNASAAQK